MKNVKILLFVDAQNLMVFNFYSGVWEEHTWVRHIPTIGVADYWDS
jgi:hypothetical protein